MVIRKYFALSVVAASLALAGCSSDDDDDTDTGGGTPVEDTSTMTGNSVLDLARGTDGDGDGEIDPDSGVAELSELVGALGNYPELLNALDDENTAYTVFAPSDDAIPDDIDDTTTDDELENTLAYHVATGQAFNVEAIDAGTTFPLTLTTVQGATIEIVEATDGSGYAVRDSAGSEVALGSPTITESAEPSVVYIIDQVLTAPESDQGGDDSTDGSTDSTDGSTDSTDGSTDSTDGSTDGTDGSTDGTDGSTDGTDGSTDGTDGSTDGTDGSTDGTDGSTDGV